MTCFVRLALAHLKTCLPPSLDLFPFAYQQDRCTEVLLVLFIDLSSAYNTIIPTRLITKLCDLGINTSLCNWILDWTMLENHTSLSPRTPASHRTVCWVHSSTPSSPTTVHNSRTLSRLQTTQWWLSSWTITMSWPTGRRSSSWQHGATTTTWSSTPRRLPQKIAKKPSLWKTKVMHTLPLRISGWACCQLQVSGCQHLWGPLLDPKDFDPGQEGIPVSLLLEETE